MKLTIIKKCFQVTTGPGWENSGEHHFDTVYADTPSKARFAAIRRWEIESDRIKWYLTHTKIRRWKNGDLVARDPHPLVAQLTPGMLDKALHAIGETKDGAHHSHPNHYVRREGKVVYETYRNRYVRSADDADFEKLVGLGLAEKTTARPVSGDILYYLTDLGKDVVMTTRPVQRWVAMDFGLVP